MKFKASNDINIEGRKSIITREPGIYVVQLTGVEAGTKRTSSGDSAVDVPTLDYTVTVKKVTNLHKKDDVNVVEIVGKTHTDQIRLDVETQEDFNKKVARIAHVLTKAGIEKEAILKVGYTTGEQYAADIAKLFDPAKHTTNFNYRVIGGVMNGNAFTQAPGYIGFATPLDVEQKFSSSEIKGNNEYFAALTGQTPSAEGDATGGFGGAATGAPAGAF